MLAENHKIPEAYALADWRRRINDLYVVIRATPGPKAAHALWQQTRSAMFRDHPCSPLPASRRRGFERIAVHPYDPNWRFVVDIVPQEGAPIQFDLGADGGMTAKPVGRTDGLAQATGHELTLYWVTGYGGGLFVPFKDTHAESYGGGRYLVDAIKGADLGLNREQRMIVDFNFAYNPSCALNPAFVCPLSPAENALDTPIAAGERHIG
ncbi:DUF1684 domain-containing protein [Profundibacterium mesophilum]|uniref:DUF1684 domain-containing protein n=1 Tax=Profundibacterium mesophilum KAUST100406-0324 TaxID=1037889 RepID=A0A921NUN6_9RHOB|nr:DUF1684 domain-containing protein [Profundibacterium mesophilum]KAF0675114.1 hypothetical protein PMES_02540 [Profundibacterium mesophilum KAUST100406-0324]